jgi:lysyl-tRNA synthetase class I
MVKSFVSCTNGHYMNRLYRRDLSGKFIPIGYICPQCGQIVLEDPKLPLCDIMEYGDLPGRKQKSDDWGIPV